MKSCNQCGAHLSDNANFCFSCGVEIASEENPHFPVCRKCGRKLVNDASFCANCGEPCRGIGDSEKQDKSGNDKSGKMGSNISGTWLLGILITIVGALLISYGSSLNNSFEAQLSSLLSNGATNPGTTWIIFGAMSVALGLILLLSSLLKKV